MRRGGITRVAAIRELLDRGYGKSRQVVEARQPAVVALTFD